MRFKPYLEQAGIRYLDYSYLVDTLRQDGYTIKGDGHPPGLSYKLLASEMAADIKELSVQRKTHGDQ